MSYSGQNYVPNYLPLNIVARPVEHTEGLANDESSGRLTHSEAEQYAGGVAAELDPFVRRVRERQLGGYYVANLAKLPPEMTEQKIQQLEADAIMLRDGVLSDRELGKLVVRSFATYQWWRRRNGHYAAVADGRLHDTAYVLYRLSSAAALQQGALPLNKNGEGPEAELDDWDAKSIVKDWLSYAARVGVTYSSIPLYTCRKTLINPGYEPGSDAFLHEDNGEVSFTA